MTRRTFLILGGAFFLAGCANQSSLVSSSFNRKLIEEKSHYLAVLDFVKNPYKRDIRQMEELGLPTYKTDNYFDAVFTLPWYVGPKLDLTEDEYFIKKYAQDNLLYEGFGIKNILHLFYIQKYPDLDQRLKQINFKTIVDLYTYVFNKITSYSNTEAYQFLKNMNMIDVLDVKKIQKYTNRLTLFVFKNYIAFEVKLTKQKEVTLDGIPFDKWPFIVNDHTVYLKYDSYYVYALTAMIVDKILKDKKMPIGF